MDFPILEHLLNEISDLEVEQEEKSNSNDDARHICRAFKFRQEEISCKRILLLVFPS